MAEALFIGGSRDGNWQGTDGRPSFAYADRSLLSTTQVDPNAPPLAYEVKREIYERVDLVGNIMIYKIQSMTVRDVIERLVQAYVPVAGLSDNRS